MQCIVAIMRKLRRVVDIVETQDGLIERSEHSPVAL